MPRPPGEPVSRRSWWSQACSEVRLYDGATDRERWPGSAARLLYSSYEDLALPIDPATLEPRPDGIEAQGITDRAAGVDYYGSILRVLEEAGEFQRAEPGMPVRPKRRYYYFEKRLERARRFLWSLTVPAKDPLPLIVLGGDCTLTPARLVMERSGDDWVARLQSKSG